MSFRNYYDTSSYGRNRDSNRSIASTTTTDRPTTVTAKYINTTTPSYKSSSIPILTDKNAKDESPITAIANKYANYNKTEKPTSKYDKYENKKDYSKLTSPTISITKSRDPSPVSSSKYRPSRHLSPDRSLSRTARHTSPDRSLSRTTRHTSPDRSLSRTSRHLNHTSPDRSLSRAIRHTSPERNISRTTRNHSPDRRTKSFKDKIQENSEREKDIPSKTEKSTGYNSLSNYKLYPRTSNYTRPTTIHAPRTDTKPEITINRYAIANRLSTNYLRSPPTVKRSSLSPINHIDTPKKDKDSSVSPVVTIEEEEAKKENVVNEVISENQENGDDETETITVVTRHTSPTPPGSSAYVRTRRADMAKTVEKNITRRKRKPEMIDKEIQSDRLDDPTRSSRFGSTARTSMTNWSFYSPNNYTGYAGRYSTQYSNLRDSNHERSSRSRSTEPQPKDNTNSSTYGDQNKDKTNSISETNPQIVTAVYEQNKSDDSSEIIINVNLKLTRAKSPTATKEVISPEITITNSNLPPQAPKSEGAVKIKKVKARKSSTDSSSDSSPKKKTVKKRSKSVSSTESDQGSEISDKGSPPKSLPKKSSSSNLLNGSSKSKHSKSRESNSPESSVTLSTQSSISEDESVSKSKTGEVSRTSADEISLPTDRSGRHPSPFTQKNENGTEEAKSFLIRALAPVTNLFKIRQSDSSDNTRWPENSTSESTGKDVSNLVTESDRSSKSKNIIASNDDNLVLLKGIRPLESGDGSWNVDSESNINNANKTKNESLKTPSENNIPRLIRRVESGEKAWWLESHSDNKSSSNHISSPKSTESTDPSKPLKKCKFLDEEKPWWLDSCANIPEGIERLTPPRKSSSDSEKSEKYNFFKVRHIESGEKKDWWLTSNENSLSSHKQSHNESNGLNKSGSDRSFPMRRIRHIESGERPWWLASDKNIPEGIEKLPTPPPEESESDSSDSEEVQVYTIPSHIPPFPLHLADDEPLGDRRSPEGLETPKENENYRGTSPYENDRQYRQNSISKGGDKYISRYTDIDDILGTSGQIYSPFMDSILAKRTGQMPFDDDECEEIDPTQVRIHDSTPQRPVIKKIRSRSNIIDYRDEDQLDDATLQVFKDGDYGPYLDLDSTLGEQDEELEGLQDSRKNALVLRTQLSVRVHSIIERLLHSQGKELRRALFTLKQILQSDKDLVHEFVENKGLDCLMQVGNTSDHNYLDYILRAVGQILLYVDGMHGVMEHKRCLQWLYSLISSKFRHVVKTSLKLLLVFVEYTEKNSILLIYAIKAVDGLNGREPWYNVMKILQDFDASDTELLIYATTLINRCLNNVPDRDTYYDQVDALQDQGMDDIIQLYMSKQGTDLDLLRQLQIFEAVLLFEDGDESGTALKQLDESVISSVRRRSLNLSTSDRRKSKKHQMKEKGNQRYTSGLKQRIQNGTLGHSVSTTDAITVMRQKLDNTIETKDDRGIILNREHSIKDLAQRLTSPVSPTTEEKPLRVSDMAGIVSKAKEELAKSQSKEVIKSPTIEKSIKVPEIKVSENDLHWEELRKGCLNQEFHLCDLDFSDLRKDSDDDMLSPSVNVGNGPPPPPPGLFPPFGAPPPLPSSFLPPKNNVPFPPKTTSAPVSIETDNSTIKKNKKTVKLFWKEIQENPAPPPIRPKIGGFIWDDLPDIRLDTAMLEHLFESRTNDLIIKEKLMEPKRNIILDAKRSNAINIAMKKLPTPQTIKAAIMKMDATVIGREGIEKLLTMLPTEEEKVKIQEAQYANPDLPLGSAEQFLLTLASINELSSRLKLWVFKLDFDNLVKEVAEPVMDLKQGIELLKSNKTFKVILSTLRSVGSFLNGNHVKGFRLEYLSKVMEVKDTVHKHPLLYHVCEMIIEKFPDCTDLFSEVGPVIRASKVDFDILSANLLKLESDCKASWDHMKRVAKHDGSQIFKTKINEFLTDAAEKIILLSIIKKRVMNRYTKFLLYLGVPPQDIAKTKPSEYLKLIAEFALEYRTTRERVLQQLEKRANHRERNKTRGKMIIDVGNYSNNKNSEHTADSALKELLKTDPDTDSLTSTRRKSKTSTNRSIFVNGDLSADDEIIESLVRCATSKRRPVPRERRKNRISDKKNFNRTLDGHQSWPGRESSPGSSAEIQQR